MALESATFIDGLVVTNPVGATDQISQGDNHLRLIKDVLKNSFPMITKATQLHIAQADVASAATTDIGAVTSDHVNITGVATITGLGTVGAGTHRTVRFAASLLLTHNGTSLILPSGENIQTAADDVMECYSLGSGNWLVTHYSRASGEAIITPPGVTVRASSTVSITISTGLNATDVIDGVTLVAGDLVLVKDQSAAQDNGIYVVGVVPIRQSGYSTYNAHAGAHITVQEGTVNKSAKWQCTSPVGGTLGATALDWILTSTPIASTLDYSGLEAKVPAGWFLCNGQQLDETDFATLFDAIGTTYNTGGEGAGNFRVPDARGRVVAGTDDMGGGSANRLTDQPGGLNGDTLGDTGGDEEHTLTLAQSPAHTHFTMEINTGTDVTIAAGESMFHRSKDGNLNRDYQIEGAGGLSPDAGLTDSAGGGGAHNNVQPTIILNKIIYAGV